MKSSELIRRAHYCLRASVAVAIGILFAISASAAELLVGSASGQRLVFFASDNPENAEVLRVRGLRDGEVLVGLDVRPATGQLYALGSSGQLYTINTVTGAATAVGSGGLLLDGTQFGFDFNPVVDRIRVVSNTGQNLRLNPNTGALVTNDVNLAYAAGDSGAGSTPLVSGSAYINNDNNTNTTTLLYGIDAARDVLVTQNPPNNGTLNTVGSLGVDTSGVIGFDVAGSDGTAYASLLQSGGKRAGLYTINLATGQATFVGKIGGPKPLTSLATLGTIP